MSIKTEIVKKKCIIWGLGSDYEKYINTIRLNAKYGIINIVGVVSNDYTLCSSFDGWQLLNKSNLKDLEIDYVIVTSSKYYKEILKEAYSLGFSRNQILRGELFALSDFSFEQYISINEGKPTFIVNYCFGGMLYHYFNMPLLSPFINIRILPEDFLKILTNIKLYCAFEPVMDHWEEHEVEHFNYPVARLNDAYLHFVHCKSEDEFKEALTDWKRRSQRINYKNLHVVMIFRNEYEVLKYGSVFDSMKFDHKVGFSPENTSYKSIIWLKQYSEKAFNNTEYGKRLEGNPYAFPQYVNLMATKEFPLIRPINLSDLITGKNCMRIF